jgi:hypothetical protein
MTLTTSFRLDKREKGVQEATLLRGVLEVTREIFRGSSKAIRPRGGAELELPISVGASNAFRVEKVRNHE